MDVLPMSFPTDRSALQLSIRLLLFVTNRSATLELAKQLQHQLTQLPGDYPALLEVVELEERPYLAEHYKLVAMPALVKTFPQPAQVLAGEDLATQIEVWWSRWQGQAQLATEPPDQLVPASAEESIPTATMLQMSEELFQLRQERAQLLEQLLFKDRILAMLVHDLRSPLTATSLAVETVQYQENIDEQLTHQLLDQARAQLRKMDVMITDILEAAKGTASELVLNATETSIGDLCLSVLADFDHRIQAKQLQVATDVPPDLPSVHADVDKIRQVIANLIDNAVKYTPAQGQIWISALHRTSHKIQMTVSDTGPGIPPQDQEKIFSDTFRLRRDQQQEGYGIGLSLCRRIVRAHYGQIWVDSRLGEGSSFHFALPVYRS